MKKRHLNTIYSISYIFSLLLKFFIGVGLSKCVNQSNFTFRNPQGEIVEGSCLLSFCSLHKLSYNSMWKVKQGKKSSYRGWKLAEKELEEENPTTEGERYSDRYLKNRSILRNGFKWDIVSFFDHLLRTEGIDDTADIFCELCRINPYIQRHAKRKVQELEKLLEDAIREQRTGYESPIALYDSIPWL